MKYPSNKRNSVHIRSYSRKEAVVFRKTKEEFGGLSNMAAGFPLEVNGLNILTSEALYQACRFPHMPEIQRIIIGQRSPMTAKMKGKPHRQESRSDWDQVKVKIMRWCLRVKLAQNGTKFGQLLLRTGNRPIVEDSSKDDFWGAKVVDRQTLVGINALGRLLMELREDLKDSNQESFSIVEPLTIPDFLLDGRAIGTIFGQVDKVIEADDSLPTEVRVPVSSLPNDASLTVRQTGQGSLFDSPNPAEPKLAARWGAINRLKPYPTYKSSGVPWLGDVPEHWEVVPNRATFKELIERGYPDEQMLSVTITQGVIQQNSLLRNTSKKDSSNEDKSKYKLVCPGDIAYNKMRAWQGALGVSQHRGIVSPAYIIVRPRGEQHVKYFHYLLRTPIFTKEAERWSYGISSDQWSLRPEEFRQIYCSVPSLPEQNAIVRYLDYMDRRIRRYINAKKKLITLLKEQKQAIIHQAVTRSLDPNVRLKPSRVEWLGDIPEHWEVLPFKHHIGFQEGPGIMAADFRDKGIPLLRISCLRGDVATLENCNYLDPDMVKRRWKHFAIRTGDYLLSASASIGTVVLATEMTAGAIPYTGILRLWPINENSFMPFVRLFMGCQSFQNQIEVAKSGVAIEHFGPTHLKRMYIFVPPIEEQQAIVEYVNKYTKLYTSAVQNAQRQIDLLREYRTRLITDVVTGKLDIRQAIANLPEEAENELVIEEMGGNELIEEGDDYADA